MAEAELTTIARPYARAAFSYALDESAGLEKWAKMLALLASVFNHKSVKTVLDDPRLTTEEEAGVLFGILGEDLSEEGRNFVTVLAENGRTNLLPRIAEIYEALKAQHEKTLEVSLTSAFEVDAEDEKRLSEALRKKLQKEITISTRIDPRLLGGVIIRTEDTVIDNSVRGKLEKLTQALS